MKNFIQVFTALSLLLVTGCASFQARGIWESKTPSPGLRLEIGAGSDGPIPAEITIQAFPGAVFQGLADREPSGGWRVSLTTLKWFSNWPNGWTDASFLLDGVLHFEKTDNQWTVRVETPPSVAMVDKASIRYSETFLLGDRAVGQLTWRWDRIRASTDYLNTQFPDDWINDPDQVARFLFPELRGYQKGEHPGNTKVADSVAWDTTYSAVHFPENLRPVRNSGTMLRDWQESQGLWTLAYHWKNFWEHVDSVVLEQKK